MLRRNLGTLLAIAGVSLCIQLGVAYLLRADCCFMKPKATTCSLPDHKGCSGATETECPAAWDLAKGPFGGAFKYESSGEERVDVASGDPIPCYDYRSCGWDEIFKDCYTLPDAQQKTDVPYEPINCWPS